MNKLLIVEDDELISRMYSKALSMEGFEIDTAINGQIALEKIDQSPPDIIVCDIMMPEVNGLQVLQSVKSNPKTQHIPVIMLTNLSGTQDAQSAIKQGATAYLIKSEYKPKEIAEKIKALLNQPSTPPPTPAPAPAHITNQNIPLPTTTPDPSNESKI